MTEQQGMFTVPTRLYLTPEHRARLERFVRAHELDLAELVSRIVADYLDALPEVPPEEPAPNQAEELRRRRAELARLRARRDAAAPHVPAWLDSYITDLEAELRRLEG
jgi:hypothetical protein